MDLTALARIASIVIVVIGAVGMAAVLLLDQPVLAGVFALAAVVGAVGIPLSRQPVLAATPPPTTP